MRKTKPSSAFIEYKKGLHDGLMLAIDTIAGSTGNKADILNMLNAFRRGAAAGVDEATDSGLFDNPLMCQICGNPNTKASPFMSIEGDDRLICSHCYELE